VHTSAATNVPSSPDRRTTADLLDHLDEQIISMVLRRAELARQYQSARHAEGLPARELAREYATVHRYVARLGRRGADMVRPVLSLSQPPAHTANEE
jgi:chorismate mutase